jgi:hypothetical protein
VTLLSSFEKAFGAIFRLPELWLETWRRLLRRPLKAPLLLALSTRRSFELALPAPIFFLINVILIYFLFSALEHYANNTAAEELQHFVNLGDYTSISIIVISVIFTSTATFFFIAVARCLGVRSPLVRLLTEPLVYYLSIELVIIAALLNMSFSLAASVVALGASLYIWIIGAMMLIRASALNENRGLIRFILAAVITCVLILIVVVVSTIGIILFDYLSSTREETVDIVDGKCTINNDGLNVESIVHNGTKSMYKITDIFVTVGSLPSLPANGGLMPLEEELNEETDSNSKAKNDSEQKNETESDSTEPDSNSYSVHYVTYLKADDIQTIRVSVPSDEFLNRIISRGHRVECRYEVSAERPSENFKVDRVLPGSHSSE